LTDWVAYSEVEPFGMIIQNLQIGRVISFLANVFSKKGTRQYSAPDFTIGFDQVKKEKQTTDQIKKSLEKAFKGRLIVKPRKKKKLKKG